MNKPILMELIQSTAWRDVAQPNAAFSWLPFTVQQLGRRFRARPDWAIDGARPTGKAYYVSTTGSDAADGLTAGTALRKVATAYGKADVVEIRVQAGVYGLTNGIGTTVIAKSVSIIAESGAVIMGAFAEPGSLTFALDGTYTHTYKVTRSGVGAVWDTLTLNGNGDYTALTVRTSAADVEANPGSWYLDGSNVLWIRRADGAAVNDTNCRIVFSTTGRSLRCNANVTLYCEGIQFEGGHGNGCVQIDKSSGVPTFYADGCSFKYCTASNGLSVSGGITYLRDCVAAKNYDDGFNYHALTGTLPQAVEIDCTGRDNGNTSDTDNGSSIHDGGSIVRLNGEYARNVGRNIHDITNGTTSWGLGCNVHDCASGAADINFAVGTGASDTATMWLDHCTSAGSATDLEIAATATAYIRNFLSGGVYSGTPTAY